MMCISKIFATALVIAAAMAGTGQAAFAQDRFSASWSERGDHHSQRFEYHRNYHDRGYDESRFRYHRRACETRRSSGLGLGLQLGDTAILSANIGGVRMTDCDRRQFAYAHGSAFERGHAAYWRNPETGKRGVIRPGRHYRYRGQDCASGEAEIYDRNGDYQSFSFESCRDGSGQWRYVRQTG